MAGLVAVWLLFLVVVPVWAWVSMARVDATPDGDRPGGAAGRTYLLVGSDSRADLSDQQRREYTTGSAQGQRTDSIMLVHTSALGTPAAVVSLPRDSYVAIPGYGENKINAAFALGGPELLVETVEGATGVRIDGYLEVGFGGFGSIVDSLGGVDICVPFDMDDPKAGINLTQGCQRLDGPDALGYVRARYSDPRGDIGRAERQRQFLSAVMSQAATPSTVLLPWRYWSLAMSTSGGLAVGEDTSLLDAARIALAMRGMSSGTTQSLVVPIANPDYRTSAGSSVLWDDAGARALFDLLREGRLDELPTPQDTGSSG